LSCQFSELNAEAKLKSVQLDKDIAQNLTCFKGSQDTPIKWFKVNFFITNLFFHLKTFIEKYVNRMGKNIQDIFTQTVSLQSYRFKERWVKTEATLVSGKTIFQVKLVTVISQYRTQKKFY